MANKIAPVEDSGNPTFTRYPPPPNASGNFDSAGLENWQYMGSSCLFLLPLPKTYFEIPDDVGGEDPLANSNELHTLSQDFEFIYSAAIPNGESKSSSDLSNSWTLFTNDSPINPTQIGAGGQGQNFHDLTVPEDSGQNDFWDDFPSTEICSQSDICPLSLQLQLPVPTNNVLDVSHPEFDNARPLHLPNVNFLPDRNQNVLNEHFEEILNSNDQDHKEFWSWVFNSQHQNGEYDANLQLYQDCKECSSVTVEQRNDPKFISVLVDQKKTKSPRSLKQLSPRFKALGLVIIEPSAVQCLNVVLNYNNLEGCIYRTVINESITNVAYAPHDREEQKSLSSELLHEPYNAETGEIVEGTRRVSALDPSENELTLSSVSGALQRKVYFRDITMIADSVTSIAYVKLSKFNIDNPYEPQFYRFELDEDSNAVTESKCGLCAFCPTIKFKPFKNSSYLSHLTLEHGVFANSFVIPEGLYYGVYRIARAGDTHRARLVKGLQCPACFEVIEVACWRNKTNPLLSYFRHFKKLHLNLTKTFYRSTVDPLEVRAKAGAE